MTQIAALVAPAHVVDHRVRPLGLDLERRYQRVLRRYIDALPVARDVNADGVFVHHAGASSSCENRTSRISFVVTLPLSCFTTRTSFCASGRPAETALRPPAFS